MSLFFIICTLCLFAVPLVLGYFAGSALLGPLDWAVQTLRLSRGAPPKLLGAGDGAALAPEPRVLMRRRLDDSALGKRRLGARYFNAKVEGREVWLRSQPQAVDEVGQAVSLPLARDQRKECQYVSGSWLFIDLTDVLPKQLHLHVQWMPDENVLGHEGLAAGLLDGALQPLLRTGDQLLITEGRLGVDSPFAAREHRLPRLTTALARAANRLADATEDGHVDVAALLVDAARAEGPPLCRARAVAAMLDTYRDHPLAEDVRAEALEDESADVRFAAARRSGPDGFEVVERIVFDSAASDGLRQRGLRYLIRSLDGDALKPLLERLVREGPERLRQIAIRHAAHLERDVALAALLVAADSRDLQTLVGVAEALGGLRAPEAERTLLALLSRPALALQIAAAEALGSLGSLSAVEALLGAGQRTNVPELRLAALGAVHAIRARSSRTGVGALSLAEDTGAGGLSLPSSSDDAA